MLIARGRTGEDGRKQRPLLVGVLLLLLAVGASVAVGFPFVAPRRPLVALEVRSHWVCVHAGTWEEMQRWRFGIGFAYGGEPRVVRVGSRAWLFYFH
jgi:hypothetical protein